MTIIHTRIRDIVKAFDAHDPGILDGQYRCPRPCGWTGSEDGWHHHLADAIAATLATEAELPFEEAS